MLGNGSTPPTAREVDLEKRVTRLEQRVGDDGEGLVKDAHESLGAFGELLRQQGVDRVEALAFRKWVFGKLSAGETRAIVYGLIVVLNTLLTGVVLWRSFRP